MVRVLILEAKDTLRLTDVGKNGSYARIEGDIYYAMHDIETDLFFYKAEECMIVIDGIKAVKEDFNIVKITHSEDKQLSFRQRRKLRKLYERFFYIHTY